MFQRRPQMNDKMLRIAIVKILKVGLAMDGKA
jgi:hypothetical protein